MEHVQVMKSLKISQQKAKTFQIGDSGGPYTVERPGSPNRVQVSVHCFGASSGVGGCDAGWPSGSTRTTVFLDWIDINMIP